MDTSELGEHLVWVTSIVGVFIFMLSVICCTRKKNKKKINDQKEQKNAVHLSPTVVVTDSTSLENEYNHEIKFPASEEKSPDLGETSGVTNWKKETDAIFHEEPKVSFSSKELFQVHKAPGPVVYTSSKQLLQLCSQYSDSISVLKRNKSEVNITRKQDVPDFGQRRHTMYKNHGNETYSPFLNVKTKTRHFSGPSELPSSKEKDLTGSYETKTNSEKIKLTYFPTLTKNNYDSFSKYADDYYLKLIENDSGFRSNYSANQGEQINPIGEAYIERKEKTSINMYHSNYELHQSQNYTDKSLKRNLSNPLSSNYEELEILPRRFTLDSNRRKFTINNKRFKEIYSRDVRHELSDILENLHKIKIPKEEKISAAEANNQTASKVKAPKKANVKNSKLLKNIDSEKTEQAVFIPEPDYYQHDVLI